MDLVTEPFRPTRASTPVKRVLQRKKGRGSEHKELRALVTASRKRANRLQAANSKKTRCIKHLRRRQHQFDEAMSMVRSRVSPRFYQLLETETRHSRLSPRGRRWSPEEKLNALGMFHRGRRLYEHLRNKYIALPSPGTLRRFVKKANIKPGINKAIMKALEKQLPSFRSKDIIFMWDEMSLKKHLHFRKHQDRIVGFVDYGDEEKPGEVASHAWIGMIKSLYDSYKFPVLYAFTSGREDGAKTAELVRRSISAIQEVGFKVRASVCDRPSKHLAALRILGATPDKPVYNINGQKIHAFIDAPHLVKAVRNNLLTHTFGLKGTDIKFEHIITFAAKDQTFPARLAPKLTSSHLQPSTSKQKMDCKRAYQTLSSSVAAGLYAHAEFRQLPPEAKQTADFVLDMDSLADSFNGSVVDDPEKPSLKKFKVALTSTSPHLQH